MEGLETKTNKIIIKTKLSENMPAGCGPFILSAYVDNAMQSLINGFYHVFNINHDHKYIRW